MHACFCREEGTESLISKTLKPLAVTDLYGGAPVELAFVEEGGMELRC